ncbi:hypothetical protein PTSG_11887 [Salpingoeca rosetta]|uniref:Leucine-rich repeat domain-containing protein n=1 Tax=Salpingoeca rosetta (strain ATCC 50818 / BSB-021) TaxID=946362 RepID=F2U2G1_SALR5|nr:uncharacterized protein PTSG_11887 [Salpingoeca rosetta]EGD81813.1 hypothetical protein PTSG_11887 [Salpingoeca rosetta]|eukprot:XP_004997017.1 hypothetical protein PTSG_11887 [Salpingoeca rosetta]
MEDIIANVVQRAFDDGVAEAHHHFGAEKPLVPIMMDSALSGLGWTMDGLRQALLVCDLSNKRLTQVDLLQFYKYLQVINLSNNFLQDFRAALSLVDLIKADVSRNRLTELDFCNSTKLKTLDAGRNRIATLDSLGSLPSLHILNLEHNLLTTAAGLEGCRALRKLDLSHNAISSLRDIGHLPHLQELRVANNRLSSLDGVESLSSLHVLDASRNKISDTCALQHLTQLQRLNLSHNSLHDQASVRYCTDLKWLIDVNFIGNPFQSAREYRLSLIFRFKALTKLDGKPVTADEKSAAENLCHPSPRVTAAVDHAVHLSHRIFNAMTVQHTTLAHRGALYPLIVVTGPEWSDVVKARQHHIRAHQALAPVDVTTTALELPGTKNVRENEFTMLADDGAMYLSYQWDEDRFGIEVAAIEAVAAKGQVPILCMHERGVHSMNLPGFGILVLVTDQRTATSLTSGYLPSMEFAAAMSEDADDIIAYAIKELHKDPAIVLARQKS